MKVIGRQNLNEFMRAHADVAPVLSAWFAEVESASWTTPVDLKLRFPAASLVSKNRYIFNIKGNKYRLDTKINFTAQVVLIIRLGTHGEYDQWKF